MLQGPSLSPPVPAPPSGALRRDRRSRRPGNRWGGVRPKMSREVTVNYHTTNRTAQAGVDYLPVSGTIHFGNEETYRTITVPILDDSLAEGDEVFGLVLTDPIVATILEPRELPILIQDDERPVVLDATFD